VLIVVADTTPLNYLVLIDHIDLLPKLFEAVHIPTIVRDELAAAGAPQIVRDWITAPPAWLIVEPTPTTTAHRGDRNSCPLDFYGVVVSTR
jgi:predicted nucleic acid-binding protein